MDTTVSELVLTHEPDAVPRARRFLVDALAQHADLHDDAELIVAELVTNAVLHGAPPVALRVRATSGGVRIEVEDSGRQLPVRIEATGDAMTGRGLALVSQLSSAWGVEPTATGGKVVWAEVSADSDDRTTTFVEDVDVDALLAAWADGEEEDVYTIELGAVPTALLLEAKAHIDNIVREFTLVGTGAAAGDEDLPAPVAHLVQTVVHDFADARAQIKRQALESAAGGNPETSVRLRLPASAASAGERYLEALDEADRFARDARLLTLETPPVHQVFRRWYVEALVAQLRSVAAGEPAPAFETFLARLAREVDELSPLREAAGRLALLQRITAELVSAPTTQDVVDIVCDRAHNVLGALSARIYLLGEDGMLRSAATSTGDPALAASYEEFPVDADLPGGVALRSGAQVVFRSVAELLERFPQLADVYDHRDDRTLLVAPLVVDRHELGVLSLTFRGQAAVDEQTQRTFLAALADLTAQALERVAAAATAAQANERLAFLADASVVLSSSLDYRTVLESVAALVVPRLADWCAIQLVGDDKFETVALAHVDKRKVAWAREMSQRYPDSLDSPTGAAYVVRTGRSEVYPEIPPDLVAASAVDDEHRRLLEELGLSSALVVPLVGRSGVIGALTLIYAESGRRYDEADVSFAEDLARRAALAVETAHAFREQSGRLATVLRVAEAAQHAILATPPAQIGSIALTARYVSAAAEALVGGDLYEVIDVPGAVRVLIGDVRGKGLEAVRLATVVLGEFRAVAADAPEFADVPVQIDRRLRRYLGDEDFVTALLAEIRHDGRFCVLSCAHPPAMLASGGVVRELETPAALPLGLGSQPQPVTGRLKPGDRILFYTDGVIEARDSQGRFVDVEPLMSTLTVGPLDQVLDRVLVALQTLVGGSALGDDVALLVAEYRGE